MKQRPIHKILIIILLIGSSQSLFAQKSTQKKADGHEWFVGINGGINLYWGDIKFNSFWPIPKMQEIQTGGGFVFGRTLSPFVKLSTELNFISLRGSEVFLADTLGFKTKALSFAFKGQFNPIALFSKRDSKFAFYIESGIGTIAWKSLLQNQSTKDTLNNLGWSNPNKEIGFFIPVGIKLEYLITPRFSSYLAGNYNIVFSDLLDGEIVGKNDSYSYSALGINYYFGKQKAAPKLLPYNFYAIAYDSIANQLSDAENKPKKKDEVEEVKNPFSLTLLAPETAPHTGFDISISIAKTGIPANGFFRLLLPGGFIPQAIPNDDVSFTILGYRYEYDFDLPMNKDNTIIPIHIHLSEIEKGIYPILVEGEILDQKGNIFPIKFANYIKIVTEEVWYQGLSIAEKAGIDAIKAKEITKTAASTETIEKIIKKEELLPEHHKHTEPIKGVYRIQVMASRKPHPNLKAYRAKHKITDELFVSQSDGWYRYTLYSAQDKKGANRLNVKVRNENGIAQAFVTYYENGKRVLNPSKSEQVKTSAISKHSLSEKDTFTAQTKTTQSKESTATTLNTRLLYRIEIALAYDQPIPLYLLENKVGQEPISEFKQNKNYYYTIGEFEDIAVAKAFLDYVKTQHKLENAKIGQYQKEKRINVVF